MSTLNLREFQECIDKFITHREPIVVGMALAPSVKALLDQVTHRPATTGLAGAAFGIPFIVDPRLSEKSEVFYNEAVWKVRCAEQNFWDTQHLPPAANSTP